MSQTNSREATPTTDFYMIDDDEIVEDLLNSGVDSEIHMSQECINIKNGFLNKMNPLLDGMFKTMYDSMYADCLDLMLDDDKSVQIQETSKLFESRCLELEDNCRMLEGNIAQLNTEIEGMSKANENLTLIHDSDRNTISSLTDKVKELSILVGSLEGSDDKIQDQLQECISSLSEANARLITQKLEIDELNRENHELNRENYEMEEQIKTQQLEIDELKRENDEMEEQIEDLCVLDTTGNNYHNLELLSNVCSVYLHEENKETPSPPLNFPEESVSDIPNETSYRKTLRSGKSYN
jgi:uncharacterized protein YlxW (UPF0749 family)